MPSLEEKKLMMADVPIHSDARAILNVPAEFKTYADFRSWCQKHGGSVSKALVKAFEAIFEVHFDDHQEMLKTSRYGDPTLYAKVSSDLTYFLISAIELLGNRPAHHASRSRTDTASFNDRGISHNAAQKENRAPIQRQAVDAFGDPVTVSTTDYDESSFNATSPTRHFGNSRTRNAYNKANTQAGGRQSGFSTGRPKGTTAEPKSAVSDSWARQLENLKAMGVKVPQSQAYVQPVQPDTTQVRGHAHHHEHKHHDDHHLSTSHEAHVEGVRPCQGNEGGVRGETDADWHRTSDSFARGATKTGLAQIEAEAKALASEQEERLGAMSRYIKACSEARVVEAEEEEL